MPPKKTCASTLFVGSRSLNGRERVGNSRLLQRVLKNSRRTRQSTLLHQIEAVLPQQQLFLRIRMRPNNLFQILGISMWPRFSCPCVVLVLGQSERSGWAGQERMKFQSEADYPLLHRPTNHLELDRLPPGLFRYWADTLCFRLLLLTASFVPIRRPQLSEALWRVVS